MNTQWNRATQPPPDRGMYLVLAENSTGVLGYDLQHWHDGKTTPKDKPQWHGGQLRGWAVIYWRYLPEKPRE